MTNQAFDHREFLSKIAGEIDSDLMPKCDCPGAPERTITSLVVLACVNGKPEVFSPPELAEGDPHIKAVVDLARYGVTAQVDEKLSVGNLTIDLNVEGADALRNSPRPGTFRCVACMVRLPVSDEGPTDSDGARWCQACADEARSQ